MSNIEYKTWTITYGLVKYWEPEASDRDILGEYGSVHISGWRLSVGRDKQSS